MKAIVYHKYGPPDVLELKEVEKPTPKDNEILIRVHSSSVNGGDWHLLRGTPFFVRIFTGLWKPKNKILGADVAGRIESVGRNAKRFQPGDAVFGDISGGGWGGYGGFAEYVCAAEEGLTLKPASMTFEEAAAVPQAAVIALQSLRYKGQIRPGQQVLITGAGTFAVQIAKSYGAEVTGVDSTRKLDLMRSIGADHVIDYTREDFTENRGRYDLIVDLAAYHPIFDCMRALSAKGIYVQAGGSTVQMMQAIFLGPWISMTASKKMGYLTHRPNTEDLIFVKNLLEEGKAAPVIDRHYSLSEVAQAIRYCEEGHALGKVVIAVCEG